MSENPSKANNPFVGPRAIEYGEAIFGRAAETRKLSNLLLANRIILLHSPSGAGKTSLVQAALIPRLEERNFTVLPTIRLNLSPPEKLASRASFNRYAYSALISLTGSGESSSGASKEELAGGRLVSALDQIKDKRLFLFFDQFEEILTVNTTDREAKMAFFEQVGEALRQANRWALFAIREDYLGGLNPYILPLPTRFKHTFRLDLLGKEAAKEVIQNTAALEQVAFSNEAASQLVENLAEVKVMLPDGTLEARAGIYVEPVHLQVVCHYLWEKRQPGDPNFTADDIEKIGDVDESLAHYYAGRVDFAAERTGVKARAIRSWFQNQLITGTGIRIPVLMEPERSGGLDNAAINMLVDDHLVRRDTRSGATWFELAHDRLVVPIRRDNEAWFEQKLSVLQRQAAHWHSENRPEHLLLRGETLAIAEQWAQANLDRLSKEDLTFLKASQAARQKEEDAQHLEEERRRAQIRGRILIFIALALVVAVTLGIFAGLQTIELRQQTAELGQKSTEIRQLADTSEDIAETARAAEKDERAQRQRADDEKGRAEEQKAVAEEQKARADQLADLAFARLLVAQGRVLAGSSSELAPILAAESYAITPTWESKSLMVELVQQALGQTIQEFAPPIRNSQSLIDEVALSPDRQRLAWGTQLGHVAVWNYQEQKLEWQQREHTGNVRSVAFSPDGRWLASGGIRPELYIWEVESGAIVQEFTDRKVIDNRVYSLAFHPFEPHLAVVNLNRILILDTNTWQVINEFPEAGNPEPDYILDLAWSPDGSLLASSESADENSPNNGIIVWDAQSGEKKFTKPNDDIARTVAWSPDGRLLAAGDFGGRVRLFDMTNGQEVFEPAIPRIDEDIYAVAFSPDGRIFVRGGNDGAITLFSTPDFKAIAQVPTPGGDTVRDLKFYPQLGFNLLAAAQENSPARRFSVSLNLITSQHPLIRAQFQGEEEVRALAARSEGRLRVVRDSFGTTRLVDLEAEEQEKVVFEQSGRFNAWTLSPQGDRLAMWEDDGPVVVRALPSGEILQSLSIENQFGTSLAFSSDGQVLATSWCAALNVESGVSNCGQGKIQLWEVRSGQALDHPALLGHQDFITALAFNPQGSLLASGSRDTSIQLWDLASFDKAGLPLNGHNREVTSLAFSPDGKMLASGSRDNSLVLWDLDSSQPISTPLFGARFGVNALAFDPQGNSLLAGYEDGSVLAWNVNVDDWITIVCGLTEGGLNPEEVEQFFAEDERSPNGEYKNVCGG